MRSTRTSQPSASSQPATCRAACSWVRSSPVPIAATPGSTIMKSPPSSEPAVIMSADRDVVFLVEADHGAYSPRRHHWAHWVTIGPCGTLMLESRANTW